ncbi:hypothetical protein HDU93_005271 [Gonapodya sp. JEL0774]|nr:hypothetical protein HDU93_005271 [Gonapodya sp. JEL0774]
MQRPLSRGSENTSRPFLDSSSTARKGPPEAISFSAGKFSPSADAPYSGTRSLRNPAAEDPLLPPHSPQSLAADARRRASMVTTLVVGLTTSNNGQGQAEYDSDSVTVSPRPGTPPQSSLSLPLTGAQQLVDKGRIHRHMKSIYREICDIERDLSQTKLVRRSPEQEDLNTKVDELGVMPAQALLLGSTLEASNSPAQNTETTFDRNVIPKAQATLERVNKRLRLLTLYLTFLKLDPQLAIRGKHGGHVPHGQREFTDSGTDPVVGGSPEVGTGSDAARQQKVGYDVEVRLWKHAMYPIVETFRTEYIAAIMQPVEQDSGPPSSVYTAVNAGSMVDPDIKSAFFQYLTQCEIVYRYALRLVATSEMQERAGRSGWDEVAVGFYARCFSYLGDMSRYRWTASGHVVDWERSLVLYEVAARMQPTFVELSPGQGLVHPPPGHLLSQPLSPLHFLLRAQCSLRPYDCREALLVLFEQNRHKWDQIKGCLRGRKGRVRTAGKEEMEVALTRAVGIIHTKTRMEEFQRAIRDWTFLLRRYLAQPHLEGPPDAWLQCACVAVALQHQTFKSYWATHPLQESGQREYDPRLDGAMRVFVLVYWEVIKAWVVRAERSDPTDPENDVLLVSFEVCLLWLVALTKGQWDVGYDPLMRFRAMSDDQGGTVAVRIFPAAVRALNVLLEKMRQRDPSFDFDSVPGLNIDVNSSSSPIYLTGIALPEDVDLRNFEPLSRSHGSHALKRGVLKDKLVNPAPWIQTFLDIEKSSDLESSGFGLVTRLAEKEDDSVKWARRLRVLVLGRELTQLTSFMTYYPGTKRFGSRVPELEGIPIGLDGGDTWWAIAVSEKCMAGWENRMMPCAVDQETARRCMNVTGAQQLAKSPLSRMALSKQGDPTTSEGSDAEPKDLKEKQMSEQTLRKSPQVDSPRKPARTKHTGPPPPAIPVVAVPRSWPIAADDEQEQVIEYATFLGSMDQDENVLGLRAERDRLTKLSARIKPTQVDLIGRDGSSRVTGRHGEGFAQTSKGSLSCLTAKPGHTRVVFDTNCYLHKLDTVRRVVESGKWHVIVPLVVAAELDGLSKDRTDAKAAADFIKAALGTGVLGLGRLRLQTSKGSFLPGWDSVGLAEERTVGLDGRRLTNDDVILELCVWWATGSKTSGASVGAKENDYDTAMPVLLVTEDRNLRVKARTRDIEVVDLGELQSIVLS